MNNAREFLETFNKIHKHLMKLGRVERFEEFKPLLVRCAKENKIINIFRNDLYEYSELRNAIVHEPTNKVIADPHQATVDSIKKIYDILTKPPSALSIASSPVTICTTDQLIADVVSTMKSKVYTHIPVYESGQFKGVFSESTVIDKMNDGFNSYKFVSRQTDIFTIQNEFLSFVNENRRLGAVFVTENGRKDEKFLGIITAWDLPKINKVS